MRSGLSDVAIWRVAQTLQLQNALFNVFLRKISYSKMRNGWVYFGESNFQTVLLAAIFWQGTERLDMLNRPKIFVSKPDI